MLASETRDARVPRASGDLAGRFAEGRTTVMTDGTGGIGHAGASTRVLVGDRIATLEIDRPPRNILDLEAIEELLAQLSSLERRDDLQVLVIRGTGDDFSAGVSIEDHRADRIGNVLPRFHALLRALVELPAVTLAAVRGYCLGGGMELAAGCDLILAARDSRFGQPEINLGCFPPAAAALYPYRLGHGRTLEILLTGRSLSGDEAAEIGFANWAVSAERLDGKLAEICEAILGKSAAVTRLTKKAVAARRLLQIECLGAAENLYLDELTQTADMEEGISAFLEKREPRWKHK